MQQVADMSQDVTLGFRELLSSFGTIPDLLNALDLALF